MERSRGRFFLGGWLILATATSASAEALRYRVDASYFDALAPPLAADGTTPVVTFRSIRDGELPDPASAAGSSISIGTLTVSAPEPGRAVTISNQPFHLDLRIPELDTISAPDHQGWRDARRAGLMIDGSINGVIDAAGAGQVQLTVDRLTLGSYGPFIPEERRTFFFPIDLARLGVDPLQVLMAPGQATTSATLSLNVRPVPEPWTIAPFLLLAAGLARSRARLRMATASMTDYDRVEP
ncbi:MAG: hypothetical protein SFX72_16455 [Isosphaeraceae bacterium]|nr:hypothetical protein [Isosphaeraceae bacterium]